MKNSCVVGILLLTCFFFAFFPQVNALETKPSSPIPQSPGINYEPGEQITTLTPTLRWSSVSGTDYYALAISKYPYGSSNIVYNPQTIYGTSITVPSGTLVAGEKYRWNMQAHNSAGWSGVSSTLYFVTAPVTPIPIQGLPTKPMPLTPGATTDSGALNGPTSLYSFYWSSYGQNDYFEIIVKKYESGSYKIIFQNSGIQVFSGMHLSNDILVPGYKYCWNVRAYSKGVWSDFSDTMYFGIPPIETSITQSRLSLYVHEGSASGPVLQGVQITGTDGSGNNFDMTTGSSGSVVIDGAPGTWSFTATKSRYNTNSWSQSITSTGRKDAFITKTPVSQVRLTLYVHEGSASGSVLSGVRVFGYDGSGNSFDTTTSSSGSVIIDGVPGTWSFSASKSGYDTNSWSQSITLTDRKDAFIIKTPASEVLTVSPVHLTLYVHEGSESGSIISGVRVSGYDGSGNNFDTTTSSSGSVTIDGAPGTWSFTATKSGYDANSWSQSITSTGRKDAYLIKKPVSEVKSVSQVRLTLYVHEGSTSGSVLQGVQVIGIDGSGKSFDTTTGSSGSVIIDGVPGTWSFTASKSGYNTNSWSQSMTSTDRKDAFIIKTPVSVVPTVSQVRLTLHIHEGTASGPVIQGVQVTGIDGAGNSFDMTTDSSGSVIIDGAPGTWIFTASKSGKSTYDTVSWSSIVTTSKKMDGYLIENVPIQNDQPKLVTDKATDVTEISATLNGHIENAKKGEKYQVCFRYDKDGGKLKTAMYEVTLDNPTFSFPLNKLTPASLYTFRAVSINSNGPANPDPVDADNVEYFTTLSAQSLGSIISTQSTPSQEKFNEGDLIRTKNNLNIRSDPKISDSNRMDNVIDTIWKGNVGKIVSGPVIDEKGMKWWNVQYYFGITGWSAEDYIELVPPQSPPPSNFDLWSGQAIKWAQDHDRNKDYGYMCMRFAADAFMQKEQAFAGGNANDFAQRLDRNNQESGGWQSAPRGTLIFFYKTVNNPYGHVGIYLGNGKIIHSYGMVMVNSTEDILKKSDVGPYIGWAYPDENWRPTSLALTLSDQSNAQQAESFLENKANALSTEPVLKPAPNPIQDTLSKISTWLSQLIHFGSESKAEGESSTKQTTDTIPKAEEQTKVIEKPRPVQDTIPSQVLSPVVGPLDYTTCCDENCQNRVIDKWEFCQHKSETLVKSSSGEWIKVGHIPNGGIGQADDTYAWDVNYNLQNKKDEDAGKPVYAAASGKVAKTYGDRLNIGGTYGQVLLEHPGGWWSGYLHMKNIRVTEGQDVNDKTLLGYISNVGATANHLHFVVYRGENNEGGLKSFNVEIVPRDTNPTS